MPVIGTLRYGIDDINHIFAAESYDQTNHTLHNISFYVGDSGCTTGQKAAEKTESPYAKIMPDGSGLVLADGEAMSPAGSSISLYEISQDRYSGIFSGDIESTHNEVLGLLGYPDFKKKGRIIDKIRDYISSDIKKYLREFPETSREYNRILDILKGDEGMIPLYSSIGPGAYGQECSAALFQDALST